MNLLLEKEKNMKDKNGHDAWWHATGKCKEILIQDKCTCSKDLFDAAEKGCEDCCRKYIG